MGKYRKNAWLALVSKTQQQLKETRNQCERNKAKAPQ